MVRTLLVVSCLAVALPVAAADGAALVETHCARCHGQDGLSTKAGVPHLNGQLESYLKDSLEKQVKGKLPTTIPGHVPSSLSPDDLAALAAYYAMVQAVRPPQSSVDPAKVAQGEQIYRNRCTDCHGDSGREADKDAPLMAGQNLEYLLAQTRLFVGGQRKFGFLQDDAFKGLTLDELDAVAHYFAAQSPVVPASQATPGKVKKRRL